VTDVIEFQTDLIREELTSIHAQLRYLALYGEPFGPDDLNALADRFAGRMRE
jgi:hypothetical protein